MATLKDLIPEDSIKLVKYSAKDLIDRLGKDIITNVVESILCGGNIRHLTEGLTQRRILFMNASLIITYLRALHSIEGFQENISHIVKTELATKRLKPNVKCYLYWFLGLTGKGIQNVVRDNAGYERYLRELDSKLNDISHVVTTMYGDLDIKLTNNGIEYLMQWPSLLRCMLGMGSQVLTIRGSEKSMYGKFFEKLVLGSVLNLIGGSIIDKNDTSKKNMVYWLSQTDEEKRECDATLLVRSGFGVRFDIGFIGQGNSEIPADKLSRFERVSERGDRRLYASTIVLIDKIGKKSNVLNIAKRNGGHVIQMSGTYWVYELASVLKEDFEFYDHPLLTMTKEESIQYIKNNIHRIDMTPFATVFVSQAKSSSHKKKQS